MPRRLLACAALLLLSAGRAEPPAPAKPAAGSAKAPAAPVATEPWAVDDVVNTASAAAFQFSPDGRWLVWVKTAPDKAKGEAVPQLMRTEVATRRDVTLTRGPDGCTAPKWSPDGRLVAFLSARVTPKAGDDKGRRGKADDEPKAQLWLIDPSGGEPWPLTEGPRAVVAYDWAGPDALMFAAQEAPTYRETTLKDDKDDTVVVEDERHEPPARLFRVAIDSKKVTRLSDNADRVEALAVSPDGRHAVAVHGRSLRYTFDNRVKPAVFLHDLASGTRKRVLADPDLNVGPMRWAADGRGFYAAHDVSSQPRLAQAGVTRLLYYDLASAASAGVDLGWERGLFAQTENDNAPGFAVTPDGFLALLADGVRPRAARYTRTADGWRREWLAGGDHVKNLFGLVPAPDGKAVVYAHSAADTSTQWHHARLDGAKLVGPAAVGTLNEHLGKRKRARVEVVRWPGGLGEEVEGLLYYPHDFKEGAKYPLVVMIHGGPASADLDAWGEGWDYAANLVCQRGAFVLKPNYHGSAGYGQKWLESITRGEYVGPELDDVERGVDRLVERGLVDPARLGLSGWSNGAILTNALTARTTRFRAAAVGAGNVEYVSDWSSCEFGDAFDRFYFGTTPLADPDLYRRKSPFFLLDRVRTPTLIFHGTEDKTVGTQQGWAQYRALQQLGKAEVRFVLFPGEKHVLTKLAHQRRKLEEELAWFDRYLFGKPDAPAEALKADSPLAWALARAKARRDGVRYGVRVKGVLLPETVAHGGLWVGRFEVTRAQYAEFDRTYAVDPGRENYPAAAVPFEKARDYCAWLSKATGGTYRLPTAVEGEGLYGESGPNENTLDHWAGYAVNPDDAARLRGRLEPLGGGAPLLREVGTFRGSGPGDPVFDLGGNVAEWVAGKDGRGRLMGGSADAPADPRRGAGAAGPEYRGFRVVRDGPGG